MNRFAPHTGWVMLLLCSVLCAAGQDLAISRIQPDGSLVVTNGTVGQRYSLEGISSLSGSFFTNAAIVQSRVARTNGTAFRIPFAGPAMFFRARPDPYELADFAGHWSAVELIDSRHTNDYVGWVQLEMEIGGSGSGTITNVTRRNGDSSNTQPSLAFTIGADGAVGGLTVPAVLTLNKNVVVGVRDDGNAANSLVLLNRRQTSGFTTADLGGTWSSFELIVSRHTNDFIGWVQFDWQIDAEGNGTVTRARRSSGDTSVPPGTIPFPIAVDGSFIGTGMRSFMTPDKQMLLGIRNDGNEASGLFVLVRRDDAGTFATNEMTGFWTSFELITSRHTNDYTGWVRMEWRIDESGNGAILSARRSNGDDSVAPGTFPFAVPPNGFASDANSRSLLSLNREVLVGVRNDGNAAASLFILVRR